MGGVMKYGEKCPGADYRSLRSGGVSRTSSRTWEHGVSLQNYNPHTAGQPMCLFVSANGDVYFIREDRVKPKHRKMTCVAAGRKQDLWDTFKRYAVLNATCS